MDLFHTKINHRKKNRVADIVKWMKKMGLHISEKNEDKSDIEQKIALLSQVLQNDTKPHQHVLVSEMKLLPSERNCSTAEDGDILLSGCHSQAQSKNDNVH